MKPVVFKTSGDPATDGAGVKLRRYLGTSSLRHLDPFLMLDEFRSDSPKDYIAGFPDHPHRGFETVTYLLHGVMEHQDSLGNSGLLETGGVQWMTTGRGIIHSEMPKQKAGLLRGYQLWVNLPKSLKMSNPGYVDISKKDWATLQDTNGRLELLAGTLGGTIGPHQPKTPLLYLHWYLKPGGEFRIPYPSDWNGFFHVGEGEVLVGDEHFGESQLGVFGQGDHVWIRNPNSKEANGILVAGEPIREPIVQYGPFVMNTEAEIQQAFRDYQTGILGRA